jgi:hypothetical protein
MLKHVTRWIWIVAASLAIVFATMVLTEALGLNMLPLAE